MIDYCIKPGYRSRAVPEYFDAPRHTQDGTLGQPAVYPFAATLARRFGCTHIIDVGCGAAQKLTALSPEFEIVGIDFGSNLSHCRRHYPFGQWLEHDLDKPGILPIAPDVLRSSVIVCADVIEHLIAPEHVVELLFSWLASAPVAVLSTPDRDLARGPDDMGPPGNTAHVREWTRDELGRFLESRGVAVEFMGLTESNNQTWFKRTSLVILRGAHSSGALHAPTDFRVAALLVTHNDEDSVAPAAQSLGEQGLTVHVVDIGSSDATLARARALTERHVAGVWECPIEDPVAIREGKLLDSLRAALPRIQADWLVALSPTERLVAPWQGVGLRDALFTLERSGYHSAQCTLVTLSSSGTTRWIPPAELAADSATLASAFGATGREATRAWKADDFWRGAVPAASAREEQSSRCPYRFVLGRAEQASQMDELTARVSSDPVLYQDFFVERLTGGHILLGG